MSISALLRGTGGELEIGRATLAGAGVAAVITPIIFQAWDMSKGAHFDVTAWCLAYPGGLATLAGAGILSIGAKDKAVASARQTIAQPPLNDKTAGEIS